MPQMTQRRAKRRGRGRGAIKAGGQLALLLAGLSGAAFGGPPFRTDDPEPVDAGHWELNLFSQGTQTSGGMIAVLPAFEANYGAAPNLQLHAIVPVGYQHLSGMRAGFGLGDMELGVKYRFITPGENDWYPQVAIFPLVEVPIGNQRMGLSTGHAQVFLPVWLQKDFEPWSIYGGGGYWINPGIGNKDYWFFGAALWRQIGTDFHLGAEVFHQTPSVVGAKASTGFNLGAVYDISEHWHVLSSAGTGMQNQSSTNQFSYYLGIQLTF